jgi:small subunit ribosomal protein S16
MEVVIRLQKAGKSANKCYNYRIVAMSRARSRQYKHLDLLGYYDAAKNPGSFMINREKLERWLKNGAQMSDTVKTLAKKHAKS